MSLDPATRKRFDDLVSQHRVVLFMKGNRRMPQCGFSARVVEILDGLVDDYETVNVLADPEVRAGIKEYSDWPTIPQLYIDGEFVGGCDIVTEMAGNGELHQSLGVVLEDVAAPAITVTASAAAALADALQGEDAALRFKVPANFRYEMTLGSRMFGDVEVQAGGVTFLLDRASAKRADGTVVDHVTGPMGAGFRISNPNEPATVQQIAPAGLKALLADKGDGVAFVDVRTPQEHATARIAGARLLDAAAVAWLEGLDKEQAILVFHCHHGMRSQTEAERWVARGFKNVLNLAGGIDAWSQQVDPAVPRY
jgi:monothiol glutaredoxin